jgi:hypothetical protein
MFLKYPELVVLWFWFFKEPDPLVILKPNNCTTLEYSQVIFACELNVIMSIWCMKTRFKKNKD